MNARFLALGLAAIGGIGAIVGSIGDWVKAGGITFTGTDANAGKTTLIAAAVGLVLAAVSVRIRWLALVAAIPAGIAGAVSGWYAANPDKFVEPLSGDIAWGLVLSAIGSIVLFVACLLLVVVPSRQTTTAPVA